MFKGKHKDEKPNHTVEHPLDDFNALLKYISNLAHHKLGYPVSLLTYLGIIDNQILGIDPNSLANILLNNVGDPFKDSETSLMEVKRHERKIISILEKYYGMGEKELKGYVTTGGTEGNFAGLWWSKRFLINSLLPFLIKTDDKIKTKTDEEQQFAFELAKISTTNFKDRTHLLQNILDIKNEIIILKNHVQEMLTPTVFYSKNHTHYSIPKIAEILKLNIRPVDANEDGSINLDSFYKEVFLNLQAHPHSALIVIANIGTTITGAVDDVPGLKSILNNLPQAPLYSIHLDGALTGFVLPILKPFGNVKNYFDAIGANTLAVSAHKYPGLSQPCGVILANRPFFEKAFEKSERSIDYVGNILDVTITGSRSGLNVLMFFHALYTLGLHENSNKLKKMVQENLQNAKYLYQELIKIYGPHQVKYLYHFNVIFPKPSMDLAKKYQLMITSDTATICVLSNVSIKLIDEFVQDLKLDKEITMIQTTTQLDYQITPLSEEYLQSTVDLLVRAFCDSEPLTKHLNIPHEDYVPFATEVALKAIKDGLSKVAINNKDKVVACVIGEDIADTFYPKISHYSKLRPIFLLLQELSRNFLEGRNFEKGKVIHIWIAAVDPEYRGKRLSTEIDMACIKNAARKGYDFAYAEFTNKISEKVTKQFNVIKLCNRILVNEFVIDKNNRPFEGLNDAASSYVAAIRPGVKMESLKNYYTIEESY